MDVRSGVEVRSSTEVRGGSPMLLLLAMELLRTGSCTSAGGSGAGGGSAAIFAFPLPGGPFPLPGGGFPFAAGAGGSAGTTSTVGISETNWLCRKLIRAAVVSAAIDPRGGVVAMSPAASNEEARCGCPASKEARGGSPVLPLLDTELRRMLSR